MRMAPRDPNSHLAKVGIKQEVQRPDPNYSTKQHRTLKERSGFSGGFKIPEEYRKNKQKKMGSKKVKDLDQSLDAAQQNQISKDEILQSLNLGNSESGMGVGRHGTTNKAALAKDLVENIQKDLDKLKRQQENIQLRKQIAQKGSSSIDDQTETEKQKEIERHLRFELTELGAHVISASPKKLQVMRHQASQLESTGNLSLEQLEEMRTENEHRLKELAEIYKRKKENSQVGGMIRDKMGYTNNYGKSGQSTPRSNRDRNQDTFGTTDKGDHDMEKNRSKSNKRVRIVDNKDDEMFDRDDKPNMYGDINRDDNRNSGPALLGRQPTGSSQNRSRSRSKSQRGTRPRNESPEDLKNTSPRRQIYEAKFEKYVANKENKKKLDKKLECLEKEDFDRFTKGPESPSKKTYKYQVTDSLQNPFNRYDSESLIPKTYDQDILQQEDLRKSQQQNEKDEFGKLGVSSEDKMTFFLLKWVFNAIKRDSSLEDPKLKGRAFITKSDLVKQLSKNQELMKTLGYDDTREVSEGMKVCGCAKDGCLMWEEFLDFFFLRHASMQQRIDSTGNWWRRIGQEDDEVSPQKGADHGKSGLMSASPLRFSPTTKNIPRYGGGASNDFQAQHYDDLDRKPVKMTESLKHLQDTRKNKLERDIENEFKSMQEKRATEQKQTKQQSSPMKKSKRQNTWEIPQDEDMIEDTLGFKREKSQCLLLPSQLHIMKDIFEAMDRYDDQILRRAEFIMRLRTDERVVDFIDADSVKLPYKTTILTLDEILVEVEKDEMYEKVQIGKNQEQINHKEFITWREFVNYFTDFKEIEERNRKAKEVNKTRQSLQKERTAANGVPDSADPAAEIQSLMEQEKERRLKELPSLRPADQIDITEQQLQLIKDIFDSLPRASIAQDNVVHTIEFFIGIRKNPQIRTLSTAIARDPQGTSRLQRETFQEVFDRMENDIQTKQLDWPTVVEYFTKRGRPLTKDEIFRLRDEDRRQREAVEYKQKQEEEAERNRVSRLMEDLEDKEDFDEFEMRQQNEQAVKLMQEKKYEYQVTNEDEDEYSDDQMDRGDENCHQGYTSDPELATAQRNYKFDPAQSDKRGRDMDAKSRTNRPKSAKTYEEGNLREMKLTTKDYMDHQKSQNQGKAGLYKITVPKPFNFDIRQRNRSKSIREQKVEQMVQEKNTKEENIINSQFRSKPVPPEVTIPRYQTIMENNESRRLEVKKNSMALTRQNEKPFNFYLRDLNKKKPDPEDYLCQDLKRVQFKANPIPRSCSVLMFDQLLAKQEADRENRKKQFKERNAGKAKLPERMQMHEEKKKQMPPKTSEVSQYSFKPHINKGFAREEVKKVQERFMSQISKRKRQNHATVPKSPNFTKTSTKNLDRQYLNEGQPEPAVDKFKAALMKSMAKNEDKAAANPSCTKASTLAMERRRLELENKRKQDEACKKEDHDRIEKQQRMKVVVQAALADRVKDDKEKREKALRDKKAESRQIQKEGKKKIQEIEAKAKSQPLLVERNQSSKHASNLAKIKATQAFLDVLKNEGLDPKEHLSDEQRELLAEQEHMEKRKKQLGK